MSVVGEQDGIAMQLLCHMDELAVSHEPIEEYWEGDPPAFLVQEAEGDEQSDHTFVVTTDTGNRFRVTVEVEES
jgi:hypothetical protein